MYSHGPHVDVTELELSPIVGKNVEKFLEENVPAGPLSDDA